MTTLTATQTALVTITDRLGNPPGLEDVPVWASSDPAVLEVTAAADGRTSSVRALSLGASSVTASTTYNGQSLVLGEDVFIIAAAPAKLVVSDVTEQA